MKILLYLAKKQVIKKGSLKSPYIAKNYYILD